jgi:hypothetical protein
LGKYSDICSFFDLFAFFFGHTIKFEGFFESRIDGVVLDPRGALTFFHSSRGVICALNDHEGINPFRRIVYGCIEPGNPFEGLSPGHLEAKVDYQHILGDRGNPRHPLLPEERALL